MTGLDEYLWERFPTAINGLKSTIGLKKPSHNIAEMKSQHSNIPTLQHSVFYNYFNFTLKYLLILISIYYIAIYIWIVLHRINYPFELEWQEGAMVDHCRRILNGQPLYPAPDLAFTPFFYPPLYFFLSSAWMKLIGLGLFAPRLVSFLASLGTMALIFSTFKRETGSAFGGLLAVGLFAAAYRATGAWLDIARVDSLFIFWLALGIFWARRGRGKLNALIVALIFSLAFHTKQFALLPALAVGLYYLLCNRRQFLIYAIVLFIGIVGGVIFLHYHYQGWYEYYVFRLPAAHHSLVRRQLKEFWLKDMLATFPVAGGALIYFWVVRLKDFNAARRNPPGIFYILMSVSLLLISLVGRGNVNSYVNTLLPISFIFSLLLGWAWVQLSKGDGLGPLAPRWMALVNVLILAQFLLLFYLPSTQIPNDSDRRAGESLIRFMRQVPGKVYIPYHGYLPYLAGKETSAHWVAILDVLVAWGDSENDPARALLGQLENAIKDQEFEVLILDREDWFPDLIGEYYEKIGILFPEPQIFYPLTGYRTRPQYIYRKIFPRPVR